MPAKRDVYIKPPMEGNVVGYCGKISVGFFRRLSSPCLFYHPGKDFTAVVYGDDFTLLGAEAQLNWLEA